MRATIEKKNEDLNGQDGGKGESPLVKKNAGKQDAGFKGAGRNPEQVFKGYGPAADSA